MIPLNRAAGTLPLLLLAACVSRAEDIGLLPGAGDEVVFTGAGDIAVCGSLADDSTAALLDTIPGLVWTTGDNAYPSGSARDFAQCFDSSWGRHRDRTRPVPGNHEYWTPGARAYFDYFGTLAGEPGAGWYSYRFGSWLIVALNSNLETDPGSPQGRWLRALLAGNPSRCSLAYFHHPLVSSGSHGSHADPYDATNVRPLWNALYEAGVEVVLVGHDHHYERFAPMTPRGLPDPDYGIRQFIVGTGGGVLRGRGREPHPLSERFLEGRHGVLRLMLGTERYRWTFIDAQGRVLDQGATACH